MGETLLNVKETTEGSDSRGVKSEKADATVADKSQIIALRPREQSGDTKNGPPVHIHLHCTILYIHTPKALLQLLVCVISPCQLRRVRKRVTWLWSAPFSSCSRQWRSLAGETTRPFRTFLAAQVSRHPLVRVAPTAVATPRATAGREAQEKKRSQTQSSYDPQA